MRGNQHRMFQSSRPQSSKPQGFVPVQQAPAPMQQSYLPPYSAAQSSAPQQYQQVFPYPGPNVQYPSLFSSAPRLQQYPQYQPAFPQAYPYAQYPQVPMFPQANAQYPRQAAPMYPHRNSRPMNFAVPPISPISSKNSFLKFQSDSEFRDDEEIQVAEERKDAGDKLQVSAKCVLSPVQLTAAAQEVPCMISLRGARKDLEEIERARPGLDIVCVIDISGSMNGNKLDLVKRTLGFLISKLTPSDRLSLVVFENLAFRVCALLPATAAGKLVLEGYAGRLDAGGGTNIVAGLECGLRILAHRRVANTVTALFLLSDGVDNDVSTALARSQEVLSRSQIQGDFTVHTFGYGSDHDSTVMCNIADQGAGTFHFVERLECIAEAFADSFGALVSQVAKNVEVRLHIAPTPVPCRITKMYTKSSQEYFSLPAVMANESKDFVFILEVGPGELPEAQICPVIVAEVRYSSVTGQVVSERVELAISFAPAGDQVELNVHEDVLVNFYRVKGADVLREASSLAEHGQFDQSQQCLDAGIHELQASLVASHVLVATLIRDLQDAMLRVRDDRSWRMGGAAQVKSVFSNHYTQSASSNAQCYMQPQQMAYNMQFQAFQPRTQP